MCIRDSEEKLVPSQKRSVVDTNAEKALRREWWASIFCDAKEASQEVQNMEEEKRAARADVELVMNTRHVY